MLFTNFPFSTKVRMVGTSHKFFNQISKYILLCFSLSYLFNVIMTFSENIKHIRLDTWRMSIYWNNIMDEYNIKCTLWCTGGGREGERETKRDWLRNKYTFKEYREGEWRRKCFSHQISEAMYILSSKGKLLKIDFYLWKQNGTRKYLQDLNGYNLLSILFVVYQDFIGGEGS